MRFTNNARNGVIICAVILAIALILIMIATSVPNGKPNIINSKDKLISYVGDNTNTEEMPMWKTICYIVAFILVILYIIINFVMCRCHNCGRHIWYMNIFMMYCPYCSKSLDVTKKE